MSFELKVACGQDSIMVPYNVLKNSIITQQCLLRPLHCMSRIIGHARLAKSSKETNNQIIKDSQNNTKVIIISFEELLDFELRNIILLPNKSCKQKG